MSQILKLALNKGEAKTSWVITVEYEIILDYDLILAAIDLDNFEWLYFVWAARKNYFGSRNDINSQMITFE